jgi:beta-galactosidase/beta-glucuronidase
LQPRKDSQTDWLAEVNVTVHTSNNGTADFDMKIICDDGTELASHSGSSNTPLSFQAEGAKLWSPDSPTLYNVTVTLGNDVVSSYTAFRTISRGEVNGVQRPLLNGEFVFQFGTLDQGYWPDGLYTPPNREAMEYDLKMLKSLGFNMLRKHVSLMW